MAQDNELTYDWPRIHKTEENIENMVTEWVFDQVFEYFGVDDISELTVEMIQEIESFREEKLNEYSPLQWGYSNLINQWESYDWEEQ